jgi:virulence-associated protein VagC
MKTVEIVETDKGQAVPLPDEFRFAERTVSIRRDGKAVILEPIKPKEWPKRFFEAIRIDDPAFVRPNQGATPPAPRLDNRWRTR